jgi:hypothetical protein
MNACMPYGSVHLAGQSPSVPESWLELWSQKLISAS